MSDTPSSSDRRSEIRTSRIFALVATVTGLFLSVSGILLCSANIEYGDVVALVGIALLAAGGVYGFALSRRLERIVARGVGLRRREETRKLEEIRDAHWQLSDSAFAIIRSSMRSGILSFAVLSTAAWCSQTLPSSVLSMSAAKTSPARCSAPRRQNGASRPILLRRPAHP